MIQYTIQRLLLLIPTMLGITLISFLILHVAPGDPVDLLVAGAASGDGMSTDKQKNFDAITLGWSGGGGVAFPPDAYTVWHSSQIEGGGFNFIGFRNVEVDGILERYREEFDQDKRAEMYQRFQQILNEDQPYTFLWNQRGATAYSRRFRDANWYPTGVEPNSWWVEKADRLYP